MHTHRGLRVIIAIATGLGLSFGAAACRTAPPTVSKLDATKTHVEAVNCRDSGGRTLADIKIVNNGPQVQGTLALKVDERMLTERHDGVPSGTDGVPGTVTFPNVSILPEGPSTVVVLLDDHTSTIISVAKGPKKCVFERRN